MASELRVDTLKDSSGNNSVGMAYVAGGSSKAWVDFNGTGTVSIDDSFNISSADDDGNGDYGFNYTSSMATTAYCPQATGRGDTSGEGSWCSSTRVPATSGCDIKYFDNSGNPQDQTAISWSNLGDLA